MAATQFMIRAAHLVGIGGVYPSPAYHAHSSAAPLRNRPGRIVEIISTFIAISTSMQVSNVGVRHALPRWASPPWGGGDRAVSI